MNLIFTFLVILLTAVHGAALGRLPGWPDRHVARAVAVFGIVLVVFFVEHLVGLGRLVGLWPLTLAASLYVLRRQLATAAFWRGELPWLLPFAWALVWRWSFPDIDAGSEHLTDLYFIRNYMDGATLPPPDQWLPGYRFDSYYALMHYAAALLGRLLGLSAGWSMNLAFCLLIGLLGSLAWSLAGRWIAAPQRRALVVAAVLVGGSGVAPLLGFLYQGPDAAAAVSTQLWADTRFAGLFDQQITAPWGQALYHSEPAALQRVDGPRELPLETTGYYLYVGDFHPPLAGFLLLFLTLALLAWLEREPAADAAPRRRAAFAAGATVPAAIALNAWVFPLQALLVALWAGACLARRRTACLAPLAAGGLAAAALLYPFLSHFAPHALATPIRLVPDSDRTPPAQWLTLWWPVLWLALLSFVRRLVAADPASRVGAWAAAALLVALAACELVYVDDPGVDRYNRFNTVLKWWSWLYPAGLALLAAPLLGLPSRAWRALAALPLVAACSYLVPQLQYLTGQAKPHAGRLAGDAWLRDDPADAAVLRWLRAAPAGLVLEGLEAGAYTPASALALHGGQPSATGWPDHLAEWHGGPWFIAQDAETIRALYRGALPDAGAWLAGRGVRYAVWNRRDRQRAPGAFALLRQQLAERYDWLPLMRDGEGEFGVWRLRQGPPAS